MTDKKEPQWYWERYVAKDGTWRKGKPTYGAAPPGEDLAALRTGLGRDIADAHAMWPFYQTVTLHDKITDQLSAEHHTLALYGLHQQSQHEKPMHDPRLRSTGTALRVLRDSSKTSAEAVDRRFAVLVSSTSVNALVIHLRGLITQLRSIDQPLNYTQLLRDIYHWYKPTWRQQVRRNWGSTYFRWSAPRVDEDNETASPAATN